MAKVKQGDTVKVNYTGKLKDGSIFDSSEGGEPIQFTIGEQTVLPEFEKQIVGMEPGESKKLDIPSDKAYGNPRDDLVVEINRNQIPGDVTPEPGQFLQIGQQDENMTLVRVLEVSDEKIKLDANHPLAGEDLSFEITLVEIV